MAKRETTKIILVRHGETADNRNGIFQGQAGASLNDEGRAQAGRLAARLSGARVAAVYTSDLLRARQTAEAIAASTGHTPLDDADLREIFLGAWQGLTHAEIAERFPDEWTAWKAGTGDLRRGGGETYGELATRLERGMTRIATAHAGATTVVVSHGAALKTFAGHVLGMGAGSSLWLRSFQVMGNTGVSVVEHHEGGFRILVWNDTAHLGDAILGVPGAA
jgi:probable phosphoglycerate mutase